MMNTQPRWRVTVEYKDYSEYTINYSLLTNAMATVTKHVADVELELINSVALYDTYSHSLRFYYSTVDNC